MVKLLGLPGTSGDTDAVGVSSRTAAIRELRNENAITASGDHGAINVWVRDDGMYQCEFMKFRSTRSSKKYKHLVAVDQWLRDWFPCLNP